MPTPATSPHRRSRLQLPAGPWATVFETLCAHFPAIGAETWRHRFARGRVLDGEGNALPIDAPYRLGAEIAYFREVPDERAIPFAETVLHVDDHLLVADKPHFLPVTPAGQSVHQTLLARLVARTGNQALVPLHRIDRDTAGLVLFSTQRASRGAYHALFRERRIEKHYEAIAPALPGCTFPLVRATRLVEGEPFFRMREADGAPNSETRIDVIERDVRAWRYALSPVTGKKHQLRVHMAALGAPIIGDAFYPTLAPRDAEDYSTPLQLLAASLKFVDPLSGAVREFQSSLRLTLRT